ncbi:hypothetical protein DMB42_35570 [Nonomuraea sp. WAC 01424]|nr:hypothetical protein DMB42_35570 [Nonomuraea sp. WAC 01424]
MTVNEPESMTEESPKQTIVRLYGVPIQVEDGSPYIGIVYAGFKTGRNEVRLPTSRTFYIRREQIGEHGMVPDYIIGEKQVYFYDTPLVAEIIETIAKKVNLGPELAMSSGGTLAGLVATPPSRPVYGFDKMDQMSALELLEKVRQVSETAETCEDHNVLRACASLQQSYSWSSGGLGGPRPDPWGADCDNLQV